MNPTRAVKGIKNDEGEDPDGTSLEEKPGELGRCDATKVQRWGIRLKSKKEAIPQHYLSRPERRPFRHPNYL